mmetsp:Transcript_33052/g.102048  ORF Transcript_33052/g.102048 Transcript_33052/m.102048 type:complete len:372 (+) Transcript_33052:2143-3258(+)
MVAVASGDVNQGGDAVDVLHRDHFCAWNRDLRTFLEQCDHGASSCRVAQGACDADVAVHRLEAFDHQSRRVRGLSKRLLKCRMRVRPRGVESEDRDLRIAGTLHGLKGRECRDALDRLVDARHGVPQELLASGLGLRRLQHFFVLQRDGVVVEPNFIVTNPLVDPFEVLTRKVAAAIDAAVVPAELIDGHLLLDVGRVLVGVQHHDGEAQHVRRVHVLEHVGVLLAVLLGHALHRAVDHLRLARDLVEAHKLANCLVEREPSEVVQADEGLLDRLDVVLVLGEVLAHLHLVEPSDAQEGGDVRRLVALAHALFDRSGDSFRRVRAERVEHRLVAPLALQLLHKLRVCEVRRRWLLVRLARRELLGRLATGE